MIRLHQKRQGFTLIEILIVGALLALFAGIAIINISEMYNNNLRKAAVGETHNLATACSMASQDLGFIPKFNYLTESQSSIQTSTGKLRGDFDYLGFISPVTTSANKIWPAPGAYITNFSPRGYFSMSQTRSGMNRGKGGVVKVRLPSLMQTANGVPAQNELPGSLVDWPADPWGNPYVLYLLKTKKKNGNDPAASQPAEEGWQNWQFVTQLADPADYKMAVVSYGPNGYPGTVFEKKVATDPFGTTNGQPVRYLNTAEMGLARLYLTGDAVNGGPARFTLLKPEEYELITPDTAPQNLRTYIVKGPNQTDAAGISKWNQYFPTASLGPQYEIRGVFDPGSDDIAYVF